MYTNTETERPERTSTNGGQENSEQWFKVTEGES